MWKSKFITKINERLCKISKALDDIPKYSIGYNFGMDIFINILADEFLNLAEHMVEDADYDTDYTST